MSVFLPISVKFKISSRDRFTSHPSGTNDALSDFTAVYFRGNLVLSKSWNPIEALVSSFQYRCGDPLALI